MSKYNKKNSKYGGVYKKLDKIDKQNSKKKLGKTKIKGRRRKQLNKNIFIWMLVGVLVVVAVILYNFLLMPRIILNGNRHVTIDYQEKYKELGYKGVYQGENITKKVKVSGKVNSKKLGKYDITYTLKHGLLTDKVTRTVEVKDKSAPEIKLVSDKTIYVCPGKKYEEEKFQAIDNYDGDLTKKVKVTKTKDLITYTVSDKAKNKTSVSRKIKYEDKEKPTINLEGGEIIYAFVGEGYVENGYSAIDNCDGDITKKVKVSGNVNTAKLGENILTYTVKDKSANEVSAKRKVLVVERGKNGTIYLTFDDGPKNGTTNVILDILKEEGIKGTFFVTNSGPDELIKRAYDEGHSVALHTASHNYALLYSSVDAYFDDLYSIQSRVKRITGYESKIIRFPGGSSNTISRKYSQGIMSTLTKEVLNRGFKYYDWNISSGDAEAGVHSADEIYNNVIKQLSLNKVNMVLMHDIKAYTRDSLKRIIQYGKNNGYSFEAITMGTEMITQRVNN